MPDRSSLHRSPPEGPRPLRRKLGWFLLLWLGGVGAVSLMGLLIRWVLSP